MTKQTIYVDQKWIGSNRVEYLVRRTTNTVHPKIGDVLSADRIQAAIRRGVTVNIAGPKK